MLRSYLFTAFTAIDLRQRICVFVVMYVIVAKIVSAVLMVVVMEMVIMKMARVVVATNILLSALIRETRSARGTGRREK